MIAPTVAYVLVSATITSQSTPAGDALVIESDSTCPSAEAVKDALSGLRPAADWSGARVAISATDHSLLVTLGSPVATTRQLEVGTDCAARANTVALVVATWLWDLPAETVVSPTLPPSPLPDPGVTISTAPPKTPTRPEQAPSPGRREVGAGVLAAFGGGIVPGLRLEIVRRPREGWIGWQASLGLTAPRDAAVGGGTTRWLRASGSVSLQGRMERKRYFLGAEVGIAAAYTAAWGQGYAVNQSDQSLTGGAVAGVRAGIPWGRVRIWSDARAMGWLYGQTVQIDADAAGSPATLSLPAWDIQLSLGASYVF